MVRYSVAAGILAVVMGLSVQAVSQTNLPPAPGETIAVMDPYTDIAQDPNPLYFTTLVDKPWWNAQSEARVPVVVAEPIGLWREAAPVSVFHVFPAGIVPESIRVVSPLGKEMVSQVRVVNAASNLMEVVFQVHLRDKAQVPVFIYYGKTALPPSTVESPDVCLQLVEKDNQIILCNNRFEARFVKNLLGQNPAALLSLKPHGALFSSLGGECTFKAGDKARIIDNGPLRKTIAYGEGAQEGTFSVYAGVPMLFGGGSASSGGYRWTPAGDTMNDVLYYATEEGVKKLPVIYYGGNTPGVTYRFDPYIQEGWLVYHDEARNEMVGKFVDLAGGASILTHWSGFLTWLTGSGRRAAYYCARENDPLKVRRDYIAWKNPARVAVGQAQAKVNKTPAVPILGQDFILMHLLLGTPSGGQWVDLVREYGGNYGMIWTTALYYKSSITTNTSPNDTVLDDIVTTAHAAGVGVSKGYTLDYLGDKGKIVARELAEHKVDAIWLADESAWWSTNLNAQERVEFRQTYKLDPPSPVKVSDLKDPAQHSFFRYCMERTTRLYRDLGEPARAVNPKIIITQTTSPGNLLVGGPGFQDIEALADVQTTICSDIYSFDPMFVNHIIKLCRGAMGNRRPELIISGWSGFEERKPVELNQYLNLMYGANALAYFILPQGGGSINPYPGYGVKDAFEFIEYTGLGRLLAPASPMDCVGIFRDTDEFLAGLKRGEYNPGRMSDYEHKIEQFLNALNPIPATIVFSKYFKPELLSPYKVVVVPDNPSLSEASAAILRTFAEAGGSVILEARTLAVPAAARLAKVKAGAAKAPAALVIKGIQDPIKDLELNLTTVAIPLKLEEGAEALATLADGSPAITVAACGKGRIVAVAPSLAQQLDTVDAAPVYLKKLAAYLAGSVPVFVDHPRILVSVLTNGAHVVVGAFNPTARAVTFSMTLKGFPTNDVGLIDMKAGRWIPLADGTATGLTLAANSVDFYRLADPNAVQIPAMTVVSNLAWNASAKPGMKFLRVQAQAKASASKKTKVPETIYVGLFKTRKDNLRPCEMGAEAMLTELKTWPKIEVEYMEDMDPGTLAYYDVVVMPNLYDGTPLPKGWEANVRAYVEQGGSALLVHHAVGYRECSDAAKLFPEVGQGVDFTAIRKMEAVSDHPVVTSAALHERFKNDLNNPAFQQLYQKPVMKKGDVVDTGFPDYIVLKPGPDGMVAMRSVQEAGKGGSPSVVVGVVGKGKIVLSGMDIGCRETKEGQVLKYIEALTPGERNLLVNSVYWLGARK